MASSKTNKHITEKELTQLIKQLNLSEWTDPLQDATSEDVLEHPGLLAPKQDGQIEVKDQKIVVVDPINSGALPSIGAVAPVKLFINGEPVVNAQPVSSKDRIHWEVEDESLYTISVANDKLSAWFHLHSRDRYAWKLEEVQPSHAVMLKAVEDKTIVLESVHLSDVAAMLDLRGIKSNLDLPAIQRELTSPNHLPIVVARGKEPINGQDAELELFFSEQVESQFYEIDGSVDYRNHLQIPSVNSGDLIARKIPLKEGMPGYDVYGNVILPEPGKDIIIVAKSGVELTQEGNVIARKIGRPRVTGTKIRTFDISTSYIVSGDVDIETGNIVFSGDVIVYGNVMDHMIIESLGNVYIYGCVYNAVITATGSIHVRGNILGSKLYSGFFGVMYNRLYTTTKALSEHIEKLLAASSMLEKALDSRDQSVRFGQIVLLIMENKFREIPSLIKELLTVISSIQSIRKEEYHKLQELSGLFLQPVKLVETATHSSIQGLLALLRDTFHEVARMQETTVQIIINQCNNSELKSNGNIVIQKEGVLLSNLFSAGDIRFVNENSVCRGSKLEAEGEIAAKIVGGMTGTAAFLKANRQIKVRKMYSGRVCVGRYSTDIFDIVENRIFSTSNLKLRA